MADASVRVAIIGDDSSLQQSLAASQSRLKSFGAAVGKIAVAAGVAAAGGLAILGKASVDAASQAQQSVGASETVYGKYADSVIKNSRRAADALGLSQNAYRENANVLGALLGNQGVAQDKLAGKTKSLIKTGADLAATFGGTTTDAVNALASAFKGEFDPLEQYGISIKQSTVNTEAFRIAGVKTQAEFDKLSKAQQTAAKQQATTNLIMQQSAKSQGAFARETNTLAHQQQVLGAQWDNLKVKIGNALMPVVTALFKRLTGELMPALQRLAKQYLPELRDRLTDLVQSDPGATFDSFKDKLASFGAVLAQIDWETVSSSARELIDTIKELGPALADVSIEEVNDGIKVFGSVVGFAADHLDLLKKALPFIVTGFIALKAAQLANNIAGRDSIVGLVAQWVATRRLIAANKELAAITREVAIAQGVQLGSTEAVGGAAVTATSKVGKLGVAARGAAGVAGLGLLTASAMGGGDALGGLANTAGLAATGFAIGGPWGAAIGGAVGLTLDFKAANDKAKDSVDALAAAMAAAGDDVAAQQAAINGARNEVQAMQDDLHSDSIGEFFRNSFDPDVIVNFTREAWGLKTADEELAEAADYAQQKLDNQKNGVITLTNVLPSYIGLIGDAVQAAQDEADALTEATNAMKDKRREANRGLSAELDYQAAIDDADASLKENGKTVDKTTEKGRANRQALYDLADAWNQQSNATKNAKGSLESARRNFIDTATAMGMPIDQAKKLANRLFEIPPKRKTQITLEGVGQAIEDAKTLKQVMDNTHSKDIYLNLHYQTIGNKPKAPTPGDPNDGGGGSGDTTPRLVGRQSQAEINEGKAHAYNYGAQAGDSFGHGAVDAAEKHRKPLFAGLFANVSEGSEAIDKALGKLDTIIDKQLDKLLKKRQQAIKKRLDGKAEKKALEKLDKHWKDHVKRVKKATKDERAALIQNGKDQDANKAALESASQSFDTYANAIKDSFVAFGDISQLGRLDSGKVSLKLLLKQLTKRRDEAQEFQRLMTQLAGMNLNKDQIEQLTAAGPEQGLATARAIVAGGDVAVKKINDLSDDIAKAGGGLGDRLADQFSIVGTNAAKAMIQGLKDKQGELDAAAKSMAAALVREVKKQLGIKSPSRVFAEMGEQTAAGLVKGIDASQVYVTRAGAGMADSLTKGYGQPKLSTNAVNGTGSQGFTVEVRLSADQVSQLERGRSIQVDLDAYRAAGGRSRA